MEFPLGHGRLCRSFRSWPPRPGLRNIGITNNRFAVLSVISGRRMHEDHRTRPWRGCFEMRDRHSTWFNAHRRRCRAENRCHCACKTARRGSDMRNGNVFWNLNCPRILACAGDLEPVLGSTFRPPDLASPGVQGYVRLIQIISLELGAAGIHSNLIRDQQSFHRSLLLCARF